jgi:hypothetical protein
MQTQGSTTFDANQASAADTPAANKSPWEPAPRVVITAVLVGAAVGAWSAVAMDRLAGSGSSAPAGASASFSAAPPVLDPPATTRGAGRSLVVAIPSDDDYITSTTIPLAGTAVGRPHGRRISVVRVELLAGGRVIESADLEVHSGRFAGALQLGDTADLKDAELRVSDPGHPGREARSRHLTIDPR